MSDVEFTFTYSSNLYTGSGTIDATPDPAAGANDYLVVSIAGTFGGGAIMGLLPTGNLGGDNLIVFPNTPYLDADGLSFTTNADGGYKAFGASDYAADSGGGFTLEVACLCRSGLRNAGRAPSAINTRCLDDRTAFVREAAHPDYDGGPVPNLGVEPGSITVPKMGASSVRGRPPNPIPLGR